MIEIEEFRIKAATWLAANLPERDPNAGLRSTHGITPDGLAAAKATQKRVYGAGFMGIAVPLEYGGQGLTAKHQRVWMEESARYALPLPGGIASSVTLALILPTILAHGTEDQKRAWVPKILSGDEIWVQLLSEPGAGSDLAGLLTRATRDGDSWVINGTKVWSSGAMSADFGICLARTDWEVPKHRGLTWFKVPLRDPRVTVRPIREINGGAEFCEEFLDDVAVGDDMVIGPVNGGWSIANFMLGIERGGGASEANAHLGSNTRRRLAPDLVALAEARGSTDDAAVRQIIAKAHIADYMQTQLVGRVIESMMAGQVDPSAASLIKLGIGLRDPDRAAAAMEIAGRSGIAWAGDDDPGAVASVNFLNGRIYSIAGGSNQIQRNIIAERLLGLPREPSIDGDKPFREVLRDAKSWGSRS